MQNEHTVLCIATVITKAVKNMKCYGDVPTAVEELWGLQKDALYKHVYCHTLLKDYNLQPFQQL